MILCETSLSCPCVDVRLVWVHVTLVFMLLQKSVCFVMSNKARHSFYLSLEQDDWLHNLKDKSKASHISDYVCICREIWPRRKSTQLCGEWKSSLYRELLQFKGSRVVASLLFSPGGCSETAFYLSRHILWVLLALLWPWMLFEHLACLTWR